MGVNDCGCASVVAYDAPDARTTTVKSLGADTGDELECLVGAGRRVVLDVDEILGFLRAVLPDACYRRIPPDVRFVRVQESKEEAQKPFRLLLPIISRTRAYCARNAHHHKVECL